jgi:hypothetical protein
MPRLLRIGRGGGAAVTPKATRCLTFALIQEGGYVHQPPDPETYRGVSRSAFPHWVGWPEIDARKPIRRGVIFADLEPIVLEFYEAAIWDKHRLEERDEALALVMADYLTNSGAALARLSRLPIGYGPMDVLRDRWRYLGDLALGFVNADPVKVAYWTSCLPGWAARIEANLDAVRAIQAKGE